MEIHERYMYQMAEPPLKIPNLNEYIVAYKLTRNWRYFEYYLHFKERSINRAAQKYCLFQNLTDRFADVKQTIVEVMCDKLTDYDFKSNIAFGAFVMPYIKAALTAYVAQYVGSFSVKNFRNFKKINAIYYSLLQHGIAENEAIDKIAADLNTNREKILKIISFGTSFKYPRSFDYYPENIAENIYDDEPEQGLHLRDYNADPAAIFPVNELRKNMYEIMEKIDPKFTHMFCEANNICCNCLCFIPYGFKQNYAALAKTYLLRSESAVSKAVSATKMYMCMLLTTYGDMRALALRFIGKEDIGDGLIRYTYSYQADCLDKVGVIDNIYDTATNEFWGYDVTKLADWDKRHSFPFAKWAIMILENHAIDEKGDVVWEWGY